MTEGGLEEGSGGLLYPMQSDKCSCLGSKGVLALRLWYLQVEKQRPRSSSLTGTSSVIEEEISISFYQGHWGNMKFDRPYWAGNHIVWSNQK